MFKSIDWRLRVCCEFVEELHKRRNGTTGLGITSRMAIEIPRLKLVHKVLLLVAVPLIFQCLFIVTLESLWQQSRDHRRASDRSARILVRGHRLLATLQQADIYRRFQINDEVAELNSKAKAELAELNIQLEEGDRYREQFSVLKPYAKLDDITGGASADLENILTKYLSREEGSITLYRENFKKLERYIHQLVAFLLAINLITCFFLILYFSQNVLSKLRTIVANSERFAEGKELLPSPGGDDEISHLDKVFRNMTDSITRSRQREHQLLGMVSHDLRTPLNTVLATLNTLSEGVYGELTDTGKQRVKQAETAVERLTRLANDLLDLEKLSSGKIFLPLEPVSLDHSIKRACESVAGFSDFKNIAINVPETDRYVLADQEKLVQVFTNLLSNAIKFSEDGAAVSIEIHELGACTIEIRVCDTGCGVAFQDQNGIFEPFKQGADQTTGAHLKGHGSGSGLGLAICKTIIEAHGGTIGLESKPGAGSVFFIRLRRAEAPVKVTNVT